MFARKLLVVSMLGCASLILLTGCFSMPWARTGNQGGGTIVTATTKLLSDDLGSINPDEVQLLADTATQVAGISVPAVSDEQAAAVVTFLADNNITSLASLQAVILQAQRDPTSIVISEEVMEVLQALAGNADQYDDLQNIDVQQLEDLAEENSVEV